MPWTKSGLLGFTPRSSTTAADPATPGFLGQHVVTYLTSGVSSALYEAWYRGSAKVSNLASFWLNENGAPRAAMPKNVDVAMKFVGWGINQANLTVAVEQRTGDGTGGRYTQWGIDKDGRPAIGATNASGNALLTGSHVLPLAAGEVQPANGTPPGTVVMRRAVGETRLTPHYWDGATALPGADTASDGWTRIVATADTPNSTVNPVAIAGLDVPALPNGLYELEAYIIGEAAIVATGVQVGIASPASVTLTAMMWGNAGAATGQVFRSVGSDEVGPSLVAIGSPRPTPATHAAAVIKGMFRATNMAAPIQFTVRSETAGSQVVAKADSVVKYRRVA